MIGVPFKRFRLPPQAGRTTEHRVPGGTWCLELEAGAQHGVRLGFDPHPDQLSTVPFDAPGVSVLGDGAERFWIHWPDTVDTADPLELTAWTTPGRYDRRPGNEKPLPIVWPLAKARTALPSTLTLGPWSNLPWDQLVLGRGARLSTGARLVAYFGVSTTGGLADARLEVRESATGTWEMVKGLRGVGVPSVPTTTWLAIDFDVPVPLADFRFVVASGPAASVNHEVYLLLGP